MILKKCSLCYREKLSECKGSVSRLEPGGDTVRENSAIVAFSHTESGRRTPCGSMLKKDYQLLESINARKLHRQQFLPSSTAFAESPEKESSITDCVRERAK